MANPTSQAGRFWALIERSRKPSDGPNRRAQVQRLQQILSTQQLDELRNFHTQLCRAVTQANKFDIMVAAYVVHSHITDDLYEDFRIWLILHGEATYRQLLADIDALTSILRPADVNKINIANAGQCALQLYLDRGGTFTSIRSPADRRIKTPWPESRQHFEKQYPALYKAYWNQKQIAFWHQPRQPSTTPPPAAVNAQSQPKSATHPIQTHPIQSQPPTSSSQRPTAPARKPHTTTTASKEKRFWALIERSRKPSDGPNRLAQVRRLQQLLASEELHEVLSFQTQFTRAIVRANKFDVMVASFLIHSRFFDNLYDNFRVWLILHGQATYRKLLADIDALPSILHPKDVRKLKVGNAEHCALNIYYARGGDGSRVRLPSDNMIRSPWPKSRQEFQRRYPVLYNTYWNQNRINFWHRPPPKSIAS